MPRWTDIEDILEGISLSVADGSSDWPMMHFPGGRLIGADNLEHRDLDIDPDILVAALLPGPETDRVGEFFSSIPTGLPIREEFRHHAEGDGDRTIIVVAGHEAKGWEGVLTLSRRLGTDDADGVEIPYSYDVSIKTIFVLEGSRGRGLADAMLRGAAYLVGRDLDRIATELETRRRRPRLDMWVLGQIESEAGGRSFDAFVGYARRLFGEWRHRPKGKFHESGSASHDLPAVVAPEMV